MLVASKAATEVPPSAALVSAVPRVSTSPRAGPV